MTASPESTPMPAPSAGLCYEPLTPTAFLRRSAQVFGERPAVVDGLERWTYAEWWERSVRLAGMLRAAGVGPGDRVAVLGSNSQLLLLSHYGVPLAGGVLVAMNARLSAGELAYILDHSGSALLLCDRELAEAARAAAEQTRRAVAVLDEDAVEARLPTAAPLAVPVADERALLALNYTSGTTGRPKGVMYHHRGAYLQALAMAFHAGLRASSVFLWVVPMFHCNGWCFTWGATAAGATHVCQRRVEAGELWQAIGEHGVTHFGAAPTVLTALSQHPAATARGERPGIHVITGGAPPSPTLLAELARLGISVTHAYGLTETFGPVMICDWHPDWDALPAAEQARLKARQGVNNVIALGPRVVDEHGRDVPSDGETTGELVLRGNDVMLGYYRDDEATAAASVDGWFRTGDVGVMHPDGYVELRDRSKDVIISGGENIASVEVEQAIVSHPAVLEAAVVAVPDERWGERPSAYVTLRQGASLDAGTLIDHVRERIARFKVPRDVHFVDELPKTSTGKIQKYVLRQEAWRGHDRRIG